MTIRISQIEEGDRFVSQHWVHTRTVDNKELITLTGIVLVNIKGTGEEWHRDELVLTIIFPDIIPHDRWLQIDHWAPFLTINAVYNRRHAVNAGWAVDEFWGPGRIQVWNGGVFALHARVAVRDIDGWLYRIGYNVTLLGTLIEPQPPD